jgi:hypothetical protein
MRGPAKTAKCTGAGAPKQSGWLPKSLYYLEKPTLGCKTPAYFALAQRALADGVASTPLNSARSA